MTKIRQPAPIVSRLKDVSVLNDVIHAVRLITDRTIKWPTCHWTDLAEMKSKRMARQLQLIIDA